LTNFINTVTMADTDAPPAAKVTAKVAKTKKAAKPKAPAAHPKYNEMISKAIDALGDRKGSSRQAILKYISGNFKVGDSANVHLKLALKRMVKAGELKHVKGSGASGSFKLAEKPKAAKKPAKKAAPKKKPAAKKTPKKAAKKPAAKKAAKKPAAKKAKKPAKPAAKKAKPAAKKAAPKKKPAKKAAKGKKSKK